MPKIIVNAQNLNDFKRWLVQMPTVNVVRDAYDFQVPLSAILYQMPALTENQQKLLAANITDVASPFAVQDTNTMLDAATRYPYLLGAAYRASGNSRNGQTFWLIQDLLKKRKFKDNIAALYVLLHYGDIYGNSSGVGEIKKIDETTANLLNEMFSPQRNHRINGIKNDFAANAKHFFERLDRLQLLNFDAASPQLREFINAGIINDGYHRRDREQVFDLINRLDEKFFTPALVQELISIIGQKPTYQDTSNAKTQAEKNKNILPKHYTKTLNVLLNMAQQRDIHDSNHYGKIKPLTRRFKEMIMQWYNANKWSDIKMRNGLINDAYLRAIETDVKDGLGGELGPEDIQTLLASDTRGYWIRKLPKNVIQTANLNLTSAQYHVLNNKSDEKFNTTIANSILNGKYTSAKDKKKYADELAAAVAAAEPQRQALATEKATTAELHKQYSKAITTAEQKEKIEKSITKLRNAFNEIQRNFKNGTPNDREEHLARNAIEAALFQCIKESQDLQIQIPQQKSLPLFGGRNTEKERRDELDRAIENLNNVFSGIRLDNVNLNKYAGRILDDESIKQARDEKKRAWQDVDDISEKISTMRRLDKIDKDLAVLESRAKFAKSVAQQLQEQTDKIKTLSAKHMGHNQTSELIPVTDDMSSEEKRRVRAKNRKALQDVLATRGGKKKPAKNLAQMLENADIFR